LVKNKLDSCAFGQVLNQEVMNIKENMTNGFDKIDNTLLRFEATQTHLFNHMSSRMTKGSVAVWCALIGIIGVLIGALLNSRIGG